MIRQNKETPMSEFIKIVKEKGKVWASPSHKQTHPDHISQYAILEWKYDVNLYSETITGKRVDVHNMPAFHIYENLND